MMIIYSVSLKYLLIIRNYLLINLIIICSLSDNYWIIIGLINSYLSNFC